MKCDVCDEEFDTENELMQHKAKMHAGGQGGADMPGEGGMQRGGMQGEGMANDDDLEEPDMPRAANE